MTFLSILNPSLQDDTRAEMSEAPAYFADLNLDQIVASITAGKQEYNLAPFFHEPLKSREAVEYRQEAMRDLENHARYDAVTRFADTMRSVREHLTQAGKLHYKYQKEAWLLDAVTLYCKCVEHLLSDLPRGAALLAGACRLLRLSRRLRRLPGLSTIVERDRDSYRETLLHSLYAAHRRRRDHRLGL